MTRARRGGRPTTGVGAVAFHFPGVSLARGRGTIVIWDAGACRSLDSLRSLGMTRCRSLDSLRSLGMTAGLRSLGMTAKSRYMHPRCRTTITQETR